MTKGIKARVSVNLFSAEVIGVQPDKLISGKVGVSVRAFEELHSGYLVTSDQGIKVGESDFAELWFLVRDEEAPAIQAGMVVDLQAGPRPVGKARLESIIEVS